MRVSKLAVAAFAVVAAVAGSAPLRAQSGEEIILADPAFSLTFAAGYIASDLDLWQKHGIKVKTVQLQGIAAINSVIAGSAQFAQASASSFGRASARGQRLIAIATTIDRPFAQVVLRKDIAQAGGFDSRDVDEDVLAAVLRLDEAVALGGVEPFDSAGSHFETSVRN